jgi:DNA invertase Pin-like site-specific DNA recombinase
MAIARLYYNCYETKTYLTPSVYAATAARQESGIILSARNGDYVVKRAFGYIRVSTARQANEGESLDVQRRQIELLAELEKYSLQAVFVEAGQSASKPLAKRPEGSKLLSAVQPGDIIIACKLDRTFRDVADAATTLKKLKKLGVGLYLRDLGGDVTRDAVSELVFGLLSSVAAFERQRIAERIADVKADQRTRSRYLGGDLPFGHRLVERDGESYIEPDADTLAILRDLRSRGCSTRLIAGQFAQQGVQVSHHAIARALRRLDQSHGRRVAIRDGHEPMSASVATI